MKEYSEESHGRMIVIPEPTVTLTGDAATREPGSDG